jgi:adenylosuccinate lyase
VIPRDRHAALVACLGILASSLDRIATEIRHLQRTDVREVEEPFTSGQKGSSSMPHKRNPIGCENVCGLARLVRAYVQAALEDIPLWHERDISHSSVERVMLPDATTLCDSMLHRMTGILDGLHVYPERMAENMGRMKGLVFSQAVLLALASAGLSRETAYEMVQRAAMAVWAGKGSFHDLLAADPDVAAALPPATLAGCFDAARSLKHVDAIYARAFGEV